MRPNMRPTEKTDPKGALNDLSAYMRKSLGVVILALVLAALSAVLTIIGPDQVGKIATIMSDGLLGGIDLAAIARVGILLAVIYGLSALFGFIQHYIMASVTLKMSYRMRAELSEKINRVPQKYFNFHAQGDILSRITNDVSTLQQGLTNSLPTIISAATQFAGCLIMMFVTEWRLALAALGITLVGLLLVVLIMSRSQKYFTARQESLGKLNGYVEEMYSGHEVVRISRAAEPVGKTFDTLNDAVYDANWRSQFLSGVMQPLMNVIGNLSYVAVCVLGSILAIQGIIDIGVIVSFILYVRLFTSPLTQIAQGMTNLQTASASAHRIFDFLGSEELPDESENRSCPAPCAAKWTLSMSASAIRIRRIRSSSRTFQPMSPPARRSPSSARPALARRPWSTCSCGSMRSPTAASELTVCRHLSSAARTYTSCSAWSCRTHGCLRAQSGKILSTICRT